MKLTTEHSRSSYGMPIFHDDEGNVMEYYDGLKKLRKLKSWSRKDLADICGVSPRTIQNWEQGRNMPSKPALLLLQKYLDT
jgi:DNA-binding XRE family transcriptional regulator